MTMDFLGQVDVSRVAAHLRPLVSRMVLRELREASQTRYEARRSLGDWDSFVDVVKNMTLDSFTWSNRFSSILLI